MAVDDEVGNTRQRQDATEPVQYNSSSTQEEGKQTSEHTHSFMTELQKRYEHNGNHCSHMQL